MAKPVEYNGAKLTKGQSEFVRAILGGEHKLFHRTVTEPLERMGLVFYNRGFRLAGCNALVATSFVLTDQVSA